MTRQTHTYVTLEVGTDAYEEVASKLKAAGYDHAFGSSGEIDMHGIALVKKAGPKANCPCPSCVENRSRYDSGWTSFIPIQCERT